ncbi:hypothetical protein [Flavobacterium sp.]|uniref:hypothetical protein n=1 Tax=Flavobacterium sp. TaxID=239 RepID=UPI003F6A4588
MKIIKKLLLLSFSTFILACGKENPNKEEKNNSTTLENVELLIEFNYNTPDKFIVYYSTDLNEEIDGSKMIEKKVFGGNYMQKLNFNFPNGDLPKVIRLDVGKNQKAENIIIKNISIKYNNKIINGDDGLFIANWDCNKSIIFDEENLKYNIVPFEGKKDPVLISNVNLTEELLKLYK